MKKKALKVEKNSEFVNKQAKRKKFKEIRQKTCQQYKYDDKLAHVPEKRNNRNIAFKDRVKLRIAYEFSQKRIVAFNERCSTDDETMTEEKYYEGVLNLSFWKRAAVFDAAINKHVENRILKENCSFSEQISVKDRKRAVTQSCRKGYRLFSSSPSQKSTFVAVPSQGFGRIA